VSRCVRAERLVGTIASDLIERIRCGCEGNRLNVALLVGAWSPIGCPITPWNARNRRRPSNSCHPIAGWPTKASMQVQSRFIVAAMLEAATTLTLVGCGGGDGTSGQAGVSGLEASASTAADATTSDPTLTQSEALSRRRYKIAPEPAPAPWAREPATSASARATAQTPGPRTRKQE